MKGRGLQVVRVTWTWKWRTLNGTATTHSERAYELNMCEWWVGERRKQRGKVREAVRT